MQIGLVGLGRMGGNIVRRLMTKGQHKVVVYDNNSKSVNDLAADGATASASLEELVRKLDVPRTVWVMLPSGKITEDTIATLSKVFESGDTVIDGGIRSGRTTSAGRGN